MSFFQQFIDGLQSATLIEYVAVLSGIASVWCSKKELIWVYPIGLINTIIYIYLSAKASLLGESAVNAYYTIMSIYGWWGWLQKNKNSTAYELEISISDRKWIIMQLVFFLVIFVLVYTALKFVKENFYAGAIPWADGLATASAFTGMWLMTRKKVESWYWWILTNIISAPLYIYKGYALTGVYYLILLVLAIAGLREWRKKNELFVEQKLT